MSPHTLVMRLRFAIMFVKLSVVSTETRRFQLHLIQLFMNHYELCFVIIFNSRTSNLQTCDSHWERAITKRNYKQ